MLALAGISPQVSRLRLRPIQSGQNTAVVVKPVQTEVGESDMAGLPVEYGSQIGIECYGRATAAETTDVVVDSLAESVIARLLADPTLGGAVSHLRFVGASYDFDIDAEATGCATLIFIARHRTAGTHF
ncbi:hypothetical protein ASF94_04315 [Acidovorax sp. Leaf160]|nr:hypothetical protein ASF94_04315 [Acidovorax sp. Leaf160]